MLATTGHFAHVVEHCRRAVVQACDNVEHSGSIPPSADGKIIKVKKGDTIDVGLDWSVFFGANNVDPTGVTSLFAKHGSSPQDPTFEGELTLYDKGKRQSVVLLDLSEAAVGDIYYLNCTVTLPGVQTDDLPLPTRTVTRTIHVRVVL